MTVRSPVVFEYQGPKDIPKILEAVPINTGAGDRQRITQSPS
ncbi:MAG: hypothetical protein ACK4HM_08015 [Thermosynechococcus sp.]